MSQWVSIFSVRCSVVSVGGRGQSFFPHEFTLNDGKKKLKSSRGSARWALGADARSVATTRVVASARFLHGRIGQRARARSGSRPRAHSCVLCETRETPRQMYAHKAWIPIVVNLSAWKVCVSKRRTVAVPLFYIIRRQSAAGSLDLITRPPNPLKAAATYGRCSLPSHCVGYTDVRARAVHVHAWLS